MNGDVLRAAAVAAGLGVVGVAAACATQSAPPGGPPDNRPPVVVAVTPDTFATIEPGRRSIRIVFDERISERTGSGILGDAVRVSPRTGEVRVEHRRDGLEVSLGGGFLPDLVYRVRVEPVVRDLFDNQMRAPFEWVFSTGAEFQPNAVGGLIWDRITGEPVAGVEVQLRAAPPDAPGFDSLPAHLALTDSGGIFALRYLPGAEYTITAFQDQNRNHLPDDFELQGSLSALRVGASDTTVTSLPVMMSDTTPPRVVRIDAVDSATLRVTLDDAIDPEQSLDRALPGLYREEGNSPSVIRVLHERAWRALRDSLAEAAREEARARVGAPPDSLVALPDTGFARPDTLPPGAVEPIDSALAVRPGAPAARAQAPAVAAPAAPTREFLPDGSPVPERSFVIRLSGTLEPGAAYTVRVQGVRNLLGLASEAQESVVARPAAPDAPPDTAQVGDSLRAPPDTNRVARPLRRAPANGVVLVRLSPPPVGRDHR